MSLLGGELAFLGHGGVLAGSIALSYPCLRSSSSFGLFCPVPPLARFLLPPGQSHPQGLAQKSGSTHEGTRSSHLTPSATQSLAILLCASAFISPVLNGNELFHVVLFLNVN